MSESNDSQSGFDRGDEETADPNGRHADITRLLQIAANGAPPRTTDPIAAMLGLIPDVACRLDSQQLRRARKAADASPSDIARQLRLRGWDFSTSDAAQWEIRQDAAAQLAPAVVQSIAAICGVEVGTLVVRQSQISRDRFTAVRQSERFNKLVARWAKAQRISLEAAIAALDSRMATTVHRGDEPDADQLLASLELLVSSVEQSRST